MKTEKQMSEAFITMAFLTLSGGLQDAYSFFLRGEVFANAQTGNIVLMSVYFLRGNPGRALRYLFPVLAFAAGIAVAEVLKTRFRFSRKLHWRQLIALVEIGLLAVVAFIPHRFDMLANILVSFSCAMQVQTFRKINGYSFASTMCIGNLRSGMESLTRFFIQREPESLKKAAHYFGIILCFAAGAGLGGALAGVFGIRLILLSCALLAVSFLMMFIPSVEREHRQKDFAPDESYLYMKMKK